MATAFVMFDGHPDGPAPVVAVLHGRPVTGARCLADVEQWAVSADPGDWLSYSTCAIMPGCEIVAAVRVLADEGDVSLLTAKLQGVRHYLAQRRADPKPLNDRLRYEGYRVADPIERPALHPDAEAVLAVLKRHINFGRPCPSDRVIARDAQLAAKSSAAYRLRQLQAAKLITIEQRPYLGTVRRTIHIVETGRSTK